MDISHKIPAVTTSIKKGINGEYYTQIWKDGVIVDVIPTDPSQIRPERISMLSSPADGSVISTKEFDPELEPPIKKKRRK